MKKVVLFVGVAIMLFFGSTYTYYLLKDMMLQDKLDKVQQELKTLSVEEANDIKKINELNEKYQNASKDITEKLEEYNSWQKLNQQIKSHT